MGDKVYIKRKDRYKTYNYKVLKKYDNNIWMTLYKVNEWDQSIVNDL